MDIVEYVFVKWFVVVCIICGFVFNKKIDIGLLFFDNFVSKLYIKLKFVICFFKGVLSILFVFIILILLGVIKFVFNNVW